MPYSNLPKNAFNQCKEHTATQWNLGEKRNLFEGNKVVQKHSVLAVCAINSCIKYQPYKVVLPGFYVV